MKHLFTNALAVLIFQLLFLGRHPMAGVPAGRDVPLHEAIGRHLFAYTRVRAVRLAPPPATPPLAGLPPGVRAGFEVAFGEGLGPRLDAAGWAVELDGLEAGLAACPRDARHHHAGTAATCPWCAIERATGCRTFGTGATSPAAPPADPPPVLRDARRMLAKAASMLIDTPGESMPGDPPQPSPAVRAYLRERRASRSRAGARSPPGSVRRTGTW